MTEWPRERVGDGDPEYGRAMRRFASKFGVADRVSWVPARPDMRAVYNALDLSSVFSNSESFPNVLRVVIACGVACVGNTEPAVSALFVGGAR